MAPQYKFDLVNRDGSIDTYEIGSSDDDGHAAIQARSAMLVSMTAVAVEVWRDGSRLCRIRRDSAPLHLASQRPETFANAAHLAADGPRPMAMAASA